MNKKVLHTLEYFKIIEMLVNEADSPLAKETAGKLLPSSRRNEIIAWQTETSHALMRLLKQGKLSFHGLRDIRPSLLPLEKGGTLGMGELLNICRCLEIAGAAIAYNEKFEDLQDALSGRFAALVDLPDLRREITRCILSPEEMADDASAELKRIRRTIKGANDRIREQLTATINRSGNMLRDNLVTMRNGRYCLPVKQEYKSTFQGMIHDQSSTGSTFFIEPMAIVKLNNELAELAMKEQEEIEVILADLSSRTADYADALSADYHILTKLDFIFAKATFAKTYSGVAPLFNTDGRIHIRKGRHPLLDKKKVVPIDVRLGEEFKLLIVTGPNTGGKTVSLKTVGLLTLMGQAGLHIPTLDRSELAIFQNVFADIGDEQSIEQSLSTFSSHMSNIIRILKKANDRSLVLFDELCAGTDPAEGAALAISILTTLQKKGAVAMATTHYSELKVFALSALQVENACCEFDVETLSPTYRLLIGIPGKSNAFAISEKLGLSKAIIEDARRRIGKSEKSFEDLLADLEKSRITIEREQLEIQQKKDEIQSLKNRLEQKQERIDANRDKILREANEEAYRIIREAKEVADTTIRNFHKYGQGSAPVSEMEKERARLRDKMNQAQTGMGDRKKTESASHKIPKNLRIGDSVKVISMNLKGTVHTLPNAKGDLYVQMGILNSLVNINDLILLEESAPSKKKFNQSGAGKIQMSKSANISAEINLIGKLVDEALPLLDKYLDDAYLSHLTSVRIVHGKGTGALRNAVHAHLKRQKYVKSYHLGEYGEGDAGVTIAEFTD